MITIDIVGYLLGCDACGRKTECNLFIWHMFVWTDVCIWKLPFEIWNSLTIEFRNGLTFQFRMIWSFNFEWPDDGALCKVSGSCVAQSKQQKHFSLISLNSIGANPGFPVGRDANPTGMGAPTYNVAKFSGKRHEIDILGLECLT